MAPQFLGKRIALNGHHGHDRDVPRGSRVAIHRQCPEVESAREDTGRVEVPPSWRAPPVRGICPESPGQGPRGSRTLTPKLPYPCWQGGQTETGPWEAGLSTSDGTRGARARLTVPTASLADLIGRAAFPYLPPAHPYWVVNARTCSARRRAGLAGRGLGELDTLPSRNR